MVSKRTFINNILEIQAREPTYRTGGVGADGTCDCVGLIMGAMYEAGHKKYDMHSSNYFARYQMEELYPVSRAEHLFTGMIVYKAREDRSQLHERYQQGGRYYTGDLLDYYHVGVVLTANPLAIIHCTSGDGVNGVTVDNKMGRWAFGGRLKDVDYSNDGIDTVEEEKPMEPYTATVTAPSGSTVNMRMRPDESAAVVVRVPIGSTVDVQAQADGWARIVWNGTVGYMMDKFLTETKLAANDELVTISLPLPVARIVMQALQEVL